MRNMNSLARRAPWLAPVVAGTMAVSGCVGGGHSNANETPTAADSLAAVQPRFRFDDLGGGSRIILVYPGTSTSAADRASNGSYKSSDVVPITCHETGRMVSSHPEVGETPRSSMDWYRLVGDKVTWYATATYGELVPPDVYVPECPAPTPSPAPSFVAPPGLPSK
ncbi:MAG TPA: hypothetical protein VF466_02135 [Candidatus Saccharimonadales bacterium]